MPYMRAIDDVHEPVHPRGHTESNATCHLPRVRAKPMNQGVVISRKRVARSMRRAHIRGASRRRGFVVTSGRDASNASAPDLVQRRFIADGPD